MSEILIDHVLLDRVTKAAKESPRLRMNYNFHESLSSPSQRLLNALEPGTVLPIHRHRHTAETYVLLRGRMMTTRRKLIAMNSTRRRVLMG